MGTFNGNHRKKRWIDPSFQGRFLWLFLTQGILCLALGAMFPLMFSLMFRLPDSIGFPDERLVMAGFVVVAIVATCVITIVSIRMSHKISGPIYRLEAELNALVSGETPRAIALRKGDELQDLVNSFNTMIEQASENSDNGVAGNLEQTPAENALADMAPHKSS